MAKMSSMRCVWCDHRKPNALLEHEDGRRLRVHQQNDRDTCAAQYLSRYGAEGWALHIVEPYIDNYAENRRRRRHNAKAAFGNQA